jgi:zinc-binding alcohol dehydrogenase/oxidoreductase
MKAIVLRIRRKPFGYKRSCQTHTRPGRSVGANKSRRPKPPRLLDNGWQIRRDKYPTILGADGAGIVAEAGEGAGDWLGKEVIINPSHNWGDTPGISIERV